MQDDPRRDRRFGGNADHRLNSVKASNSPKNSPSNARSLTEAGTPRSLAEAGTRGAAAGEQWSTHPQVSSAGRGAPRLELSLTQILGSTGAAVTAAFLGSRLGVAGTLIGAGLASVISVVGGALYTTSLKATRHQVTKVLAKVDDDHVDAPRTRPGGLGLPPAPGAAGLASPEPRPLPVAPRRADPRSPGRRTRPVLRGVVAGVILSAAVFAGALVVVTGFESVTGTALSGGSAGGLTILGGHDPGRSSDDHTGTTPAIGTAPPSTTAVSPTTSSGPAAAPASGATASGTATRTTGTSSSSPAASSTPTAGSGTGTPAATGAGATPRSTGTPTAPAGTAGTAPTTAASPTPVASGGSADGAPQGTAGLTSPGHTPTMVTAPPPPGAAAH